MTVLRQRDFGLLWWSGLVSFLGNWALRIAVPITVYELTGSATALAATTAAYFAPALVIGPFAGVLVDRWDRKRVMVATNLAQAVLTLPLLAVTSPDAVWIIVGIVFAATSVSQFTHLAENALLPRVVAPEHLAAANSLNTVNNNLARFIGPLIGGTVVAFAGLPAIVATAAGTYLLAATLVVPVRGRHRAEDNADSGMWAQFRDGLSLAVRRKPLWILIGLMALVQLGSGVFSTLYVVFVAQELGGGAAEYGWLNASQAVGGVIGGTMGGLVMGRLAPRTALGAGLVLYGVVNLIVFNYPQFYPHIPPAIVLMVLVGIPAAILLAAWTTLMHNSVPDRYRGKIFALSGTTVSAGQLAGTGIAAFAAEHLDVVTILSLHGFTALASGAAALILLRPVMAKTADPTETVEPAAAPNERADLRVGVQVDQDVG